MKTITKSNQTENALHIHIFGKKWFSKLYGNTYHTVKVGILFPQAKLEVEEFLYSEITYGYGDIYIITGRDLLEKAGYNLSKINCKITTDIIDVPRRKDLKS